jgi:Dolichyl-phosphate-mannose-protein mannosyltransferase
VPQAYAAAKAINAVVVSLAAVPAYLLARRVCSRPYAFAAAVLAMSVPTLLFAGMLMTENAFYPAFLLAALAMVAWLERPDLTRSLALLGAFVLAYLTRAQAVAILPAVATAPFLVSGRRALREFRWFFAAGAAAVLLVVVVQVGRGASVFGVFGAYEVAGHTGYSAGGVLDWWLYHWEELILSLGVVPFVALVVLALTMRGRPRSESAFLAAAVTLSFWLVLEVATFASEQSLRVEERNMFYVAPLFLTALMLWVERGCPRPWAVAVPAVAVAVVAVTVLPYTKLIGLPAVSDTTALVVLWSVAPSFGGIPNLQWLALVASLGACLLFLFVPARYALVLPLLVFVYFGVSQKPIEGKYRQTSILDLFQGITAAHPDWVDRSVGRDAQVALIWSGNTDKYSVWENEFFNRSVRHFYYTSSPLEGDLPEKPLTTDAETGLMRGPDGKVVHAEYVLTDGTVDVGGRVVAQDARKGIVLRRIVGPLRQVSRVDGLYPQDTWSGREVTYTRHDCRGGSVVVTLQSDPSLFTKPTSVVASVAGREVARAQVAPTATKLLEVPLRTQGQSCVVRFNVSPTAVPKVVTKGQNPDPRELGVHFTRFTYKPS